MFKYSWLKNDLKELDLETLLFPLVFQNYNRFSLLYAKFLFELQLKPPATKITRISIGNLFRKYVFFRTKKIAIIVSEVFFFVGN